MNFQGFGRSMPQCGRLLAWLATLVLPLHLMAQSTGIRFIFPEFNRAFNERGAFKVWNGGFGLDHEFEQGLHIGVDASFILWDIYQDVGEGDLQIERDGYFGEYAARLRSWSLTYRATYCTNGDGSGFYLGSFLGIRKVKQELDLVYSTSPNWSGYGNGPLPEFSKADAMVIPIGIRFGVRGEMDGWYGDLYAQVGYQIGSGPMEFTQSFLNEAAYATSGLTYTMGYAFGVGW
jgi:hypothetical protein